MTFQSATQAQDDSDSLDTLLHNLLTEDEQARSVVYLDEQLRTPGLINLGGQQHQQDTPYFIAFIDRKPGANWMHPCRYLLIDNVTHKITSIESDRPPLFGTLPPTWRVVWQSHAVDDWRLLPISRPSS